MNKAVRDIIDSKYKDYAMYVIGNRAIPSCIDGFKPVQRKILYAALHDRAKKIKLVELGSISKYNYHHGEASATAAAVNMAQDWNNNLPILQGHGNFGSRLVQEAAAPRYIFASVSENYRKYFQDTEIAPDSIDKDNPEPQNYLPIIPWLLVNGAKGIAVGFATEILPRNPEQLTQACLDMIAHNKVKQILKPVFPSFRGIVKRGEKPNQWITEGLIKKINPLEWSIEELPIGYDREKYINLLYKMIDDGKISSFEDLCDDEGFRFDVKSSRAQMPIIESDPIAYFKLSKSFTENLTTLDENGKLKIFNSANEIIKYFVEYRLNMYQKKIDYEIEKLSVNQKELEQRLKFIMHVREKKIDFMKLTRSNLEDYVFNNITEKKKPFYFGSIVGTPAVNCTTDEMKKLSDQIQQIKIKLQQWKKETPKNYYANILKGL